MINLSKIKTPDFLKPVFGELLFKREPESRGMEFRVGEGLTEIQKKVAETKIKELSAVGGELLAPSISLTRKGYNIPEVLKYRGEEEQAKKAIRDVTLKRDPEKALKLSKIAVFSKNDPKEAVRLWDKIGATKSERYAFSGPEVVVAIGGMKFVSSKEAQLLITRAVKSTLTRKDLIDITAGRLKSGVKFDAYKTMVGNEAMKKEILAIAKNKKIPLTQKIGDYFKSLLSKTTEPTKEFLLKGKPKTVYKLTPAERLKLVGKVPATTQQITQAHIIAKQKQMVSSLGKVKPQYRALAKGMTGKTSMKEMTKVEADSFLTALKQIQPRFIHGVIEPPVIPTTKQLTTPDFFVREFKKPTFATHLTPSDRYARTLGTYDLIEPLIKAKTKLLLERQKIFNWLDNMEKEVFKIEKVSLLAKAKAGIKAKPTVAHEKWFDLLDKNTTAVDAGLTGKSAEVFDELRGLTESILQRTNEVRLQVGLDPIQSLKSYVTHIEDIVSKKITKEKYPFPEEIKYWLNYIQPKHIFNPTALHRFLEDKPSLLKNPFKALKTMAAMDLKQIYLEKPNLLFKEQLSALKGQIPADTKKWTELYVNQVIKGFPTPLDETTNNTLNTLGITNVLDKMLAPFGRTVGINPAREISGALSRLIHDAVIWGRMKLVIRNHTQKLLTLGLYDTKSFAKALSPAGKDLQKLIKSNDFWKISNREFMERLPEGMLGKLEQIGYKPYGHSHISNIGFSMKTAYYASMDLVKNPKYAKLGWTEEDAIKEMEFGANTTQYWYNTMGMPDVYRSGIGRMFGTLQSWWMNYGWKYWREMLTRGFTGKTGWGKEIPVKWRLGAIRHILASLLFVEGVRRAFGWDYKRITLFGVLPTYLSPPGQIVTGLTNYIFGKSEWQKTKGKNQVLNSLWAFVPGSMATKDWWKAQEESNLEELFFYTEKKEPTTGGLVAPGGSISPKRKKLIAP